MDFLNSAEKREETDGDVTTANQLFMSQFNVADFGAWEDVIPEEDRERFNVASRIDE